MKRLARICYGLATLLGATGTLGCIVGLVGLWMAHSSIDRGVEHLFSRVDSSIDLVQRRIEQTQDRIDLSMIAGEEIQRLLTEQKREIAARIELPPQLTTKAERLSSSLESVLEWLETADASLTLIAQYEDLLGLDTEALEAQTLRSLSNEITATKELCQQALDFSQGMIAPSATLPDVVIETSEAKVARALRILTRAFQVLEEVKTRLQKLPGMVDNLRTEAARIKTTIRSTTLYAAYGSTLFLLWMGAAQIALCCFGWKRLF
jgi:chromosome segregation ATPase